MCNVSLPSRLLSASSPHPFLDHWRSTNESRCFSLETDIWVWKNAVRCFLNNISKNQVEKNDSRQIVFFKIIFLYLLAFYVFILVLIFHFFGYARLSVRTGSYAPDKLLSR